VDERQRGFVGGAAAGAVVTAAAARLLRAPRFRVARMPGSSIAGPDAAGWVTDFLNAAYYRRPVRERHIDDLRLASAVLATRWWAGGYRRLRAPDVLAFHRAFGRDRLLDTPTSPRGTLERGQLLEGAGRLLGDWFPDAYDDDARRGWGVVFPTAADRAAYRPEERLRHAEVGPLSPPLAPPEDRVWHTYPAVPMPSAEGVLAGLSRPETWPDYASEIGRFTPVRDTGLAGQTFEIEIVGLPATPVLVSIRAFVTCTAVRTTAQPDELRRHVEEIEAGLAGVGGDEPLAVPAGAEPFAAIDLTTHEGHFMGSARSRLVLFTHDGRAFLRDVGVWDPMRWPLDPVYQRAGYNAQQAFWGLETPEQSMLYQIGQRTQRTG